MLSLMKELYAILPQGLYKVKATATLHRVLRAKILEGSRAGALEFYCELPDLISQANSVSHVSIVLRFIR